MLWAQSKANGAPEDDGDDGAAKLAPEHHSTTVEVVQPPQGRTLLPAPAAAIVSGVTGITSFYVRAGTKIGGWGLYAGREATLKTLSVSRSVLELALVAAGRDVASRSHGEIGRAEAETLLEKSISALYSAISTVSFAASTGFFLTEASINSLSALSISGLSTLNAILGSTESSRAMAAILTLAKEELNKPEVGGRGEVITYLDLIVGTVGFVMLQRWGRRKTELDFREARGEETIWDCVIDDKGFKADVVGTRRTDTLRFNAPTGGHPMTFASPGGEDEFDAIERGTLFDTQSLSMTPEDGTKFTDEEIRDRIMAQLPPGARATITSETITAKTIKVDIYDAQATQIDPPPGTVMVAERLNYNPDGSAAQQGPQQTVIFRTALKRSSSADIDISDQLRLSQLGEERPTRDSDDVIPTKSNSKRISYVEEPEQFEAPIFSDSELDHDLLDSSFTPSPPSKGPIANQKKSRKPVLPPGKHSTGSKVASRLPLGRSHKEKSGQTPKAEKPAKDGVLKKALKTLSPNQSSTAIKDLHKPLPQPPAKRTSSFTHFNGTQSRGNSATRGDTPPRRNFQLGPFSNRTTPLTSPSLQRSTQVESSTSYFAVHDRRRDSTVSQTTETYSVHSVESRPGSPTFTRTRAVSSLTKANSELGLALKESETTVDSSGNPVRHQRSRSFVPSLYSMATKDSHEAIVLAPRKPLPRKSIYEDENILQALATDGKVPGIFPDNHLIRTVRRYSRFASASYGSNFLRIMGMSSEEQLKKTQELMSYNHLHHEHRSFATHVGLPANTIIKSSFIDPKGVTGNTDWSVSAISPLVHFISIDDDSKAIVLTCRGTLGFEDVLTDMTCDYDDIFWQGQRYKVHKGIHASARRLLGGGGSRIMITLQAALEEHPNYGLILCGHSLGGAVASVLAILISEPCPDESKGSFVTGVKPKLLPSSTSQSFQSTGYVPPITLPPGRPVHVYAYGTPATMSESLRIATRGLITTTVNASDVVPCLSLGILHDFRTVALHLKTDTSDALGALRARVYQRVKSAVTASFYGNPRGPPPPENHAGDGLGEDTWAWAALKTLRASMVNDKLVPPGEVFVVETTRVFDRLDPDVAREAIFGPDDSRDDRTEKLYRALGRPATRVQFKLVRDVETRFGELRFGRDMFGDHTPGRYEAALAALEKGVCED